MVAMLDMDEEFKKEVEYVFDNISKLGQIKALTDEQQECLSELSISVMCNSQSHDSLKGYILILKSLPSSWSPSSPPSCAKFIIKQLIALNKRISSNEGSANSAASFQFGGVEKRPAMELDSEGFICGSLPTLKQNGSIGTDANLYGGSPKPKWNPEVTDQVPLLVEASKQPFNKQEVEQPAAQHQRRQLQKTSGTYGGRQKKLSLKRKPSLSPSKKVGNNRPKKRARRKSTGYEELSHTATTSMPYEFLIGDKSSWYEWKDLNLGWVVEGSLPNSSILLPKEDAAETPSPTEECFVLITDDEDDDKSINDSKSVMKQKPSATEAVALVKETGKEITSSNSKSAVVGVPVLILWMQDPVSADPKPVMVPLANYKSDYFDLSSLTGREVQRPLEGESSGDRVGQKEEKCTYHVSGPDLIEFNSSITVHPISYSSFDPAAIVHSASEEATAASKQVGASLFNCNSGNPRGNMRRRYFVAAICRSSSRELAAARKG